MCVNRVIAHPAEGWLYVYPINGLTHNLFHNKGLRTMVGGPRTDSEWKIMTQV